MNDCRKVIVTALCCLWCLHASPQSAIIKVLTAGSDSPVNGAIVILKPLADHPSKKQEIYFTDKNGEAVNSFPYRSVILIHCYSCKEYNDTIEPGQSYTFHIEKSTVDLNEVVVTGQYDINTSDKSVYS